MASLLLRGLIAGFVASLVAFAFAYTFGEPAVERAIGLEEQLAKSGGDAHGHSHSHDHGQAHAGSEAHAESDGRDEPELVSREVQSSIGLATGVVVFGTALGGIFALGFAFLNGRLSNASPIATAVLLAAIGFLTFYLIPNLKYPANPPAVGNTETIGLRTQLYFGMILFSLASMAIALTVWRSLADRLGGWKASIVSIGVYIGLVAIAAYVMPTINEVPGAFPADLLWQFRIASLGIQGILWGVTGAVFGLLIERSYGRSA
jgi:predicted cobalt transporter CbtA